MMHWNSLTIFNPYHYHEVSSHVVCIPIYQEPTETFRHPGTCTISCRQLKIGDKTSCFVI